MKKSFILVLLLLSSTFLFSLDVEQFKNEQYVLDSLLEKIKNPGEPIISGDYIIFTSYSDIRHTGIAFDYEDYKVIHTFKNLVRKNIDAGNTKSDVAFYILKVPQNIQTVKYRIVIDGLWTPDPLNKNTIYDKNTNLYVSYIEVQRPHIIETTINSNTAYFVYEGETGQRIRLAGTFTNWDPFIYELQETSRGLYELEIPLPKGTYYYTYYSGIHSFTDDSNPEKAYTSDGRVASVITLD